jgi:environmental stress-induced protein Ves
MIEIPNSAWRAQPWKNGRGITHEIWRVPDGDGDYDLRVSLAEVTQSGLFSEFPGYRRWTFLVGPAPISLDAVHLDAPGDHIEVPGEHPIDAELLAGATTLLNVLARAGLEVVCGYGPVAHAVRFAFELAPRRAVRFDPAAPTEAAGHIWIAISAST